MTLELLNRSEQWQALSVAFMSISGFFAFVFSFITGIFMVIGDVGYIQGRNLGGGIALIVLAWTGVMSFAGIVASGLLSVFLWSLGEGARKLCGSGDHAV